MEDDPGLPTIAEVVVLVAEHNPPIAHRHGTRIEIGAADFAVADALIRARCRALGIEPTRLQQILSRGFSVAVGRRSRTRSGVEEIDKVVFETSIFQQVCLDLDVSQLVSEIMSQNLQPLSTPRPGMATCAWSRLDSGWQ
jgi:hypothetical protein